MERDRSPPAELEEEAAEEADLTVGYNSPCRKLQHTHLFLLHLILYLHKKQSLPRMHGCGQLLFIHPCGERNNNVCAAACNHHQEILASQCGSVLISFTLIVEK